MENTIDQLNKVLFETLEKAKNKEVDESYVKNITGLSSEILKSAKLQFDFHKYTEGNTKMKVMPPQSGLQIDSTIEKKKEPSRAEIKPYRNSDFEKANEKHKAGEQLTHYEKRCIVADHLKYETVGKAISDLTLEVFNDKVKAHFKNNN